MWCLFLFWTQPDRPVFHSFPLQSGSKPSFLWLRDAFEVVARSQLFDLTVDLMGESYKFTLPVNATTAVSRPFYCSHNYFCQLSCKRFHIHCTATPTMHCIQMTKMHRRQLCESGCFLFLLFSWWCKPRGHWTQHVSLNPSHMLINLCSSISQHAPDYKTAALQWSLEGSSSNSLEAKGQRSPL